MKIKLDNWQQQILDYKGDILLLKGRRIGGTEIFAIKAAERMVSQPKVKIVMLSLTEDQAKLIISVCQEHLIRKYKNHIAYGKDKPTLTRIRLKNKSWIEVRPVGNTGNAVRGFDGDILGIDEAPWQPKMMWKAARPIISTNDGEIWMWGTPAEDEGYFYEQYHRAHILKDKDARFKTWHLNSEEVLFNRPICESWTQKQHDGAIRILAEEKRDMTEEEYGNEYLGKFLSELNRFYDDELINKACKLQKNPGMRGRRYLGVDIGRMYDPSAFQDVCKVTNVVYHVDNQTTFKTLTTETQDKIVNMNNQVNYKKIGIDAGSGALGVGVYDNLLRTKVKHKLEAMNNRAMALDRDGKKKQMLKQMDYHNNLKAMMQSGEILLLDDDDVRASLASVRLQKTKSEKGEITKFKIIGKNMHIAEGLTRAADLAKRDKTLRLWAQGGRAY